MEYSDVTLKNISSTPVVLLHAILRYINTRQGKQPAFNGISLLSGEHHLAWVCGSSIGFWVTPSLQVVFVFLMYPLWICGFSGFSELDQIRQFQVSSFSSLFCWGVMWQGKGYEYGLGPQVASERFRIFIACISQRCKLFWYATRMVWAFLHLWVRPVATLKSDQKRP